MLLACLLLAGPMAGAEPKSGKNASKKDPLAVLTPPATQEERDLFKTVKGSAAVRGFLITRQYIRDAEAKPDAPPPFPKEFSFAHTLSEKEQVRYFGLSISRTGKFPKEKPVKPALTDETAYPLKELMPPATQEERDLFVDIQDQPDEIKLFLLTRKYVRAHEQDPSSRMPEDFSFKYAVDLKEQIKFFQVALDQGVKKKQ